MVLFAWRSHYAALEAQQDLVYGRGEPVLEIILDRIVLLHVAELFHLVEQPPALLAVQQILGHAVAGNPNGICALVQLSLGGLNGIQMLLQAHGNQLILRRRVCGELQGSGLKRHPRQILRIHKHLAVQHEIHDAGRQPWHLSCVPVAKLEEETD